MPNQFRKGVVVIGELQQVFGHTTLRFSSLRRRDVSLHILHPSGLNGVGAVVPSSMSGEPNPDCGGYTLSGWRAARLDETYLESWIQTLGGMHRESID